MQKIITSKNRNSTIDILKGLGIIYVVLGHTLVNPIHDFIYLFHMPLFYFISGYLYNEKYSYNPVSLVKNRLKTLYIPFLRYELVFLILHNFFYYLNFYSDKVAYNGVSIKTYTLIDFIKSFIHIITFRSNEQLLGVFWFFTVLFTINIIFCFVRFFIKKVCDIKNELPVFIVLLLLYTAGSILKYYHIELPRQIEISLIAVMIYYFGFLYRQYEMIIVKRLFIAIICFLILCLDVVYEGKESFSALLIPITWPAFAVSGIYLNIYLAEYLSGKRATFLGYIGENTIVIMALHFLCFKIINIIQVNINNLPLYMIAKFPVLDATNGWWIIYSATGIFVPLLTKWFFMKPYSYLKKRV